MKMRQLNLSPRMAGNSHNVCSSTDLTFLSKSQLRVTPVYDAYWRFAVERQKIFFRRLSGKPAPWTNDEVLARYSFTNAYRASDRVSQYLLRKVIYSWDPSPIETVFRILLFKFFNKIETWELLVKEFGEVTWRDFSCRAYDAVLQKAKLSGQKIYSGAYIMPSGGSFLKTSAKHVMHLELLTKMMKESLAERICSANSLKEIFILLRSYPTIGDFLAYQYCVDINYTDFINFSESEFVVPGPGARSGIAKCFKDTHGLGESDVIRMVTEAQAKEFESRELTFPDLWGRPLQLIDCQNLFCEIDKYSRVRFPELAGNGRHRIKRMFRPQPTPIEYWFPPKWGINERISGVGL
ncbi:MAG: nucleotide kinase domain-containing protein [Syntrophobacteraceae bacterium]|jgi:hypothetical protein